ncbi:hypothetical protein F0562_020737 [Nyssa sinensis]|uniref:Basic secretory protease n=1 Tax=Nyssa sinensis TaxID=561372 RepID=A0A5J5BW53_9ASTE|nr:hypothetical protein F0562_020737 [Nyssa sinensis]
MAHQVFFLSCLLAVAALQGILAVEYDVANNAATTPGGVIFTNQIGIDYTRQILVAATDFIWNLFQQNVEADRKNVQRVGLFIEILPENFRGAVAIAANNQINVSADYIPTYSGDIKRAFAGIVYHEMTHIWQWNGNGDSNAGGLIEGIADFVRLKADLAPAHWRQPGEGESWNQGYDVTARFLDYCEGLRNGFVAELNKKLRNSYDVNFFVELLGKTVDQLWSEYKAIKTRRPDRKNEQHVSLFIETMNGVAYAVNNEIHVSANYIQGYSGDVNREITGVLYHEITHIWQWDGNGQTPGGLIEGIADFVRLKAGYVPSHWVQPGQGDRWDHGYDVTARFLDYCNSLRNGFVAELNKKMRSGYSANYFVELLGKTVDQLWSDYKAKYKN